MNNKHPRTFSHLLIFLYVFFVPLSLTLHTTPAYAKKLPVCVSNQWPHEKSDLLPDPALVFGKLPNGFRYVLMENKEPRDRVSLHLNIQAGSLHETDEQQGFAHYLEHMMFNGSESFPPGEIVKYFQSIGMDFGPDANAHTGFDETVYDVVLPKGTKDTLEQGLMVMLDYARGALLLESEIERERGVILSEKRTRDSVGYRTYISSMKFLFPGSKVNNRMPIGIEETIKKANRKLLKNFYDTWYHPEKIVLVMAGDFDIKIAEPLIKSFFGKLVPTALKRTCPEMGTIKHEGIKTFYHYENEAGNTETSIQTAWSEEPEPDSLTLQKRIVTRYIADSIVNNRLEAMMEKLDNPFTSVSVYSGVMLNTLGYTEISAKSDPGNWKQALSALEQTLRRAVEFGFTESELDRVKKEYLAAIEAAVLKKDTRNSKHLAGMIIRNLNDDKVLQSPEQEKELYAPFIQSLTPEQVYKAFVSLWGRNHRLIMVTGNAHIKEKDKTPEQVVRAVFDESAKTKVKKPVQEKAIKFPYLPEPEKTGRILRQNIISDLGIEQTDFDNGLRLNLKKTDFKKNQVIAAVTFGYGKKTEPAPGLAMLAKSLVNKSGLGRLTKNELERALAGNNTSVSFSIEENCFLLKGNTVTEELPLMFQLLFAHLNDPGYREEVYLLAMDQFKQLYDKYSHSIDGAMGLYGNQFLAGGDTRFGMPPYNEFRKLTPTQARSWIDPARKGRLEISVVGDFDPDTVRELAGRYFGSLPKMELIEDKKESLSFPSGENLALNVETAINKGMVIMAWPTEDFSNINRVRRLSMLGHVFSEILREEIREKTGATYSQYAYNIPSRTYAGYGVFRSVLFIDPAMSEKIIRDVKKIASDLVKNGITQDELKRAVEPVLTSIKDMKRTNDYWLSTVLKHSLRRPEQLTWPKSVLEDYASVTVKDVHDMAKKYLSDEKKAAVIVIKPEP
ncbi:MAG: insulinase family protein [Desulfobacteraceae bacterium]|nr:insulinase family protein [Desulfobacteraceae bacterium]